MYETCAHCEDKAAGRIFGPQILENICKLCRITAKLGQRNCIFSGLTQLNSGPASEFDTGIVTSYDLLNGPTRTRFLAPEFPPALIVRCLFEEFFAVCYSRA